jgi:uncharacterized membrane protein YhaH (DUF805 family)
MNFGQAISAGFSNYVRFSSRSSRSEYWYWILFFYIGLIVAGMIDWVLGITAIIGLFWLATVLPTLALSVRRLHDLDRSGWWIFLALIPIVGAIVLIIWHCTRGTVGPNRFGPDPLTAGGLAHAAA